VYTYQAHYKAAFLVSSNTSALPVLIPRQVPPEHLEGQGFYVFKVLFYSLAILFFASQSK